jgi:hypothetical protein
MEDNSCPICKNPLEDPVNFSCDAQHTFCFKCILANSISTQSTKKCPLCKGGVDYIIFPKNNNVNYSNSSAEFDSISYFKSCSYYLELLSGTQIKNSSLVSMNTLKLYMLNKNQLISAKRSEPFLTQETIYPLYSWKQLNTTTIPAFFGVLHSDELMTGLETLFTREPSSSTQQSTGDMERIRTLNRIISGLF